MTATLADARTHFIAAVRRDTPGTDLPRYTKVLDRLTAWSVARSGLLALRADERRSDVISFELVGTKIVFWSASATRGAAPKLEICPPSGRALSPEERALVIDTVNAFSREKLADGDRLRIGFGALKNQAAITAILTLMKQLLAVRGASPESTGIVAA